MKRSPLVRRLGLKDRTQQKLDEMFSQYVRRRAMSRAGGCERCGAQKHDIEKEDGSIFPAWKQLQCSHFWGRNKKLVRFDEMNACGLCAACHMYLEHHPLEHVEFFRNLIGEREFDLLTARASVVGRPDVNGIHMYLLEKLKEVGE